MVPVARASRHHHDDLLGMYLLGTGLATTLAIADADRWRSDAFGHWRISRHVDIRLDDAVCLHRVPASHLGPLFNWIGTRSTNILAEPAARIVIAPPITFAQHFMLAGRKLFDIRNQIEVDWSAEPIILKPATIVVHAETASAHAQADQSESSSPTSDFADELSVEPVEIATLASDDEPFYLEPVPSMVASTHARTVVLFGKPTNDLAAIGKYLTTKGRSTIHKRSLHRVLSYLEADESSIVVMFAYQFKLPEAAETLEKLLAFRQPMLVLVNRQQADSLAMFASADVRLLSSPTSGKQLIHALNELPLHDQGEAQESLELPDVVALEDQNNQVRQFPLADVVTT